MSNPTPQWQVNKLLPAQYLEAPEGVYWVQHMGVDDGGQNGRSVRLALEPASGGVKKVLGWFATDDEAKAAAAHFRPTYHGA